MKRKLFNIIIFILIIILYILIIPGCVSKKPKDIGLKNGRFKKCPDSPNCINSQADPVDTEHYMAPIEYSATKDSVMDMIEKVIESMERTKIILKNDNYLHVEFTTKIMKFTDDVEFYIDDENKLIHFRSASRVGYSDMGLNRQRMEEFVKRYNNLNN